MEKLKKYIQLARPKHFLKNGLIFLPLFFSGQMTDIHLVIRVLMAFIAFSLTASFVYVINDMADVKKDRQHPTKRKRPIASGDISLRAAGIYAAVLLSMALIVSCQLNAQLWIEAVVCVLVYVVINIGYSFGLKNVPILDVFILSFGFILRVIYGALVSGVGLSYWLLLTIMAFSIYAGLGKRRNELQKVGSHTRAVNKHYTKEFLDKNMYMSAALGMVFYALWSINGVRSDIQIWTTPLMLALFMSYSLAIEKETSSGDPIEVLLGNKHIAVLAIILIGVISGLLYII